MAPSIQEVKNEYVEELMRDPNVVSVGIGLDEAGQPAIILGLVQPKTTQPLPTSLEGFPVITKVVGNIKAN